MRRRCTNAREKLRREPIEDYRIDFEDGYGYRSDDEEDGHAVSAAGEVVRAMREGTLPPFIGFRIKSFSEELRRRAVRTLDLFLTALLDGSGGMLPSGFVVCLPKITIPEQVTALADILDVFETTRGLASGSLKLEVMVETTRAIAKPARRVRVAGTRARRRRTLYRGAPGRIRFHLVPGHYRRGAGLHASGERLARQMMQVAFAGTGVEWWTA